MFSFIIEKAILLQIWLSPESHQSSPSLSPSPRGRVRVRVRAICHRDLSPSPSRKICDSSGTRVWVRIKSHKPCCTRYDPTTIDHDPTTFWTDFSWTFRLALVFDNCYPNHSIFPTDRRLDCKDSTCPILTIGSAVSQIIVDSYSVRQLLLHTCVLPWKNEAIPVILGHIPSSSWALSLRHWYEGAVKM